MARKKKTKSLISNRNTGKRARLIYFRTLSIFITLEHIYLKSMLVLTSMSVPRLESEMDDEALHGK